MTFANVFLHGSISQEKASCPNSLNLFVNAWLSSQATKILILFKFIR